MSSIRKRLFIWLLMGLSTLWAIAGIGIYLAVKKSELTKIDSELLRLQSAIRFFGGLSQRTEGPTRPDYLMSRLARENFQNGENRRPPDLRITQSLTDFIKDNPPKYRIWSANGTTIRQSKGLSEKDFPFPQNTENLSEPTFSSIFNEGDSYRAMTFRFRPPRARGRPRGPDRVVPPGNDSDIQIQDEAPPRNTPQIATIALNTKSMEQTLQFLLFAIIAVGIIAGFLSFLLVSLALRNGLSPLNLMGNNLSSVNSSSLSHRFSKDGIPIELSPITDHLNDLMVRLESGFNRERQFSSDLAHELRTPIAELKMMSEVALRWPEKKNENYASETLEIAQQLQDTIETLLSLNRFENGQEELKIEELCLKTIMKECLEKHENQISDKNIKVDIKIDKGTVIDTDIGIFRTILNNLLSNAAEYTPQKGEIIIQAESNSSDEILRISNSVDDMESQMLDHLFERFWRADNSRSDSSHIGLGLSLSKACAEALSLKMNASLCENAKSIKFSLNRLDS
ncbi:MAG: hypothetical protein CMO54_04765 [Verrucomicrobiales bacterium]|nr:hypothetical protein [Verrucomicrobiales bacterium]